MARARNIKPAIYTNEELADLPIAARWLFVGLWTMADREGRLEDRPKRIKMTIFPADDLDVGLLLDGLAGAGLIVRYAVEGSVYIWIPGFARHQKPHPREAPSTIPPYQGMTKATPRHDQGKTKEEASPAESLLSESPLSECSSPKKGAHAPARKNHWGDVPDGVDPDAWLEWTDYKGGSPKKATIAKLRNILAQHPPETQRKAVEHSIANGYAGLFPEKFANVQATNPSSRKPLFEQPHERRARELREYAERAEGREGVGETSRNVGGQVLEGVWECAD